ncbi:MAG TPA: hypothetical protein VLA88_04715 [Candidatus Saccharimonadales bacterium]|nr:hypothetical protein [Candidatus Saccharimonadales bacterium]
MAVSNQRLEDHELRAHALKLLTSLTHGDLFRYLDERNHDAVRHIFALAERRWPADTNPEAKEWFEFEQMIMLAIVYKIGELKAEVAFKNQNN